ncbi:uncharacterized protein PV07_09169 [Cladophialophora immunda]|uniref:Uncharacterized protein n=1 Tax=Cladophialophora immunda TaxID=569365 RepID=A0A0D2C6F1_9EURO|nr:uncharacterized protein PV07_09169 [Cladophialophora immunda]KIW26040.1 hypothetical protein PV07_09169 [Cladophialophora immunda]
MANWRERGYVPDSDEDDEGEDGRSGNLNIDPVDRTTSEIGTVNVQTEAVKEYDAPSDGDTSPTKQNNNVSDEHDAYHHSGPHRADPLLRDGAQISHPRLSQTSDTRLKSTAAKLQAEIEKGLQTVQDVLGSVASGFDSDNDSPLSSVPSSVHASPNKTQSGQSRPAALAEVAIPQMSASDRLLLDPSADASRRRSFRPRAPIQLHPYAIEDAKYRQTWRDRGLHPMRAPDLPSDLRESAKDDSQGTTADESSQVNHSDSHVPRSSPVPDVGCGDFEEAGNDESQNPIRGTRLRVSPVSDSDDDLPDLSDIFKTRTETSYTSRLKRPKRVPVQQPQTGIDGFRIYELPDLGQALRKTSKVDVASSTIPPSPPRSRDGLSSQGGGVDNNLGVSTGNSTPVVLPTPVVSSDKQTSKRTFSKALDFSDSETDAISISDDSSAPREFEERLNDSFQGARQLRRKIKGVLPASWLKLDMKQQRKETRPPRNQTQPPVKRALEKGIAQHVSSSGRIARDRVVGVEITDLEASSESESTSSVDDEMKGIEYQEPELFEDDVVEDNAVDAMLAPQRRRSSSGKGQQPLKGVWPRKNAFEADKTLSGRGLSFRRPKAAVASLSNNGARPRKKVKRRHRKPQMTILDAPGFKDEDVPRFLRIALRRTGQQRSPRKQDPSKKVFKLATMRDTEDVNQAVRDWGRAHRQIDDSVKPNDISSSSTSLTAKPRRFDIMPGNTAAPTRTFHEDIHFSDTQLNSLKQSTNTTLNRIRNHQSQSRPLRDESIVLCTNRPSAILDYFKPRGSRRSHLNSRQRVPTVEHNTQNLEGPAFASSNTFTVQKLVPREARQRPKRVRQILPQKASTKPSIRALPMSRPPGKRDFSPSSPSSPSSPPLPPSRPLKKQRPISLGTRYANNPNQHDVLCLQSLRLEDDNDIVSCVIQNPPGSSSLSHTLMLPNSTHVRVHLINTTMSSMADTTRLFQPRSSYNTITTARSQRTLRAAGWSAEVESIIRDAFKEIFELICGDVATPGTTSEEQTRLLNQAADSVESIITYANESLSFSNNEELESFIRLTSESMENVWQGVAISESATSELRVSQTLRVLNAFLILAYQNDQYATATGFPERIRAKSLKTWQNIASLAWELAFRKHNIAQLFGNIAAQFGSDSLWHGHRLNPTTEMETIFLIHHLGPHQPWSDYLETIFSSHGKPGMLLESQAESVACAVMILVCILSVAGPDGLMTHTDSNFTSSLGCSLLRLLPSQVSEFLKFFAEKKASYNTRSGFKTPRLRKLEHFGLVMFRWCFVLVRNLQTDIADNLLKQMFKYYSDKTNNMLELFTSKNTHGLPSFLECLVRAELLNMEDTDTDFHIFLKLTAITLAAQPRSDSEIEEHIRKLALRKRSLLFILLPNKGRDTLDDNAVLVNEDCPLPDVDLAAVSNRYTLFTTLYHYAPVGFKPEVSQIRDYIDFNTAHDAVRQVIVRCWENIAKSTLSQPLARADLLELGEWLLAMFKSMFSKLSQIPSVDDGMYENERRIHLANRNTTIDRILHIAERAATTIDLCTNKDQVSCLLTRQEVDLLTVFCYHDRGFGDIVVSGIFDLLTSFVKKGLSNAKDEILSLRRGIRGILVDQLNRTDTPHDILLMSLTETWFAIGKLMVEGGHSQWDHFLNAWSSMSFPQIADTEIGRQCQVLLMSKIATNRSVVLADPYPFIHTWLWSILKPQAMIKFEHCLTNQLMESIPDAFGLDDLRRNISNGATRYFLDRSDIIKHRLSIVYHIIRYAYSVQNVADPNSNGKLTKYQWDHLMTMISRAMKQTWEQLDGRARPEWTMFMQKVIFRLGMYKGPGFEIDPWFVDLEQKGYDDKVFHLERLFIRLPGEKRPDRYDTEYMTKAFRTACEMAWVSNKEQQFFQHLVTIFGANDPSYVEVDGSFLLDITEQLDFMKAVFPAYIERALKSNLPTTLFAVPILNAAAQILIGLEIRVDLEDQSHMESFAEFVVALMGAAVAAMRYNGCEPLYEYGWEIETIILLGGLCWLGCGRWAHLHRLFPSSGAILALQPYVQTYAYYAYEWICSAAGLEDGARPSDPEVWAKYRRSVDRGAEDFGFELPELVLPEHINALKDFAADDLEWSGREEWRLSQLSTWGPVWVLVRPGMGQETKEPREAVQDDFMMNEVRVVLGGLERALTRLGVMEEEL